jgi:hypothetical protein
MATSPHAIQHFVTILKRLPTHRIPALVIPKQRAERYQRAQAARLGYDSTAGLWRRSADDVQHPMIKLLIALKGADRVCTVERGSP